MSRAVSSVLTKYDAGVVSQVHELAPDPEREVFAIALLPVFEIFRRLPIFLFVEELFIGNVFALHQEFADCFD